MQNKNELAIQSRYKEFLIQNGFPENLPTYDEEGYWDTRHQLEQDTNIDWYFDPIILKDLFTQFVSTNQTILQLGSGKSNALQCFRKWGYKKLIGSDFSWKLHHQKKQQLKSSKSGISWERIDVTKNWDPQIKADCIFQKATLDCLTLVNFKKSLSLIHNALPKNGVFFHISCWKPQDRIKLLKEWNVQVYEFPKNIVPIFSEIDQSKFYYAYVCSK